MADTYTLISSVTVGAGGASSISFSSIPATYTDLQLVWSGRTDRASAQEGMKLQFNGATTNYSDRELTGNGATASSGSNATTYIYGGIIPASTATASTFGNCSYYIPNYAGSTYKSVSLDTVAENNATTAYSSLEAGLWSNTAAITSITITPENATNFVQYSTAYLYGIKNS